MSNNIIQFHPFIYKLSSWRYYGQPIASIASLNNLIYLSSFFSCLIILWFYVKLKWKNLKYYLQKPKRMTIRWIISRVVSYK